MSKMIALEWICDYRNKELTDLSFIFLNNGDSEIEQFVRQRGYTFLRIPYAGKKDILKAVFKIWKFFRRNQTEIVHTHLFDACLTGLFAALFTNVKKRIYTRHYATYHHVYFPKAVKYDKFINWLSTDIVAISQLVQNVLIEKEKYNIQKDDIVIGVVARYTMLKGIQHIIPAFVRLLQDYPNVKLLIANSLGNDEVYLRSLMTDIPKQNLIEVKYERDMGALYKSLSVYIHVPIYDHIEAFGQTYVEALMAGIPSVFTLSGVAKEFIVDERNALVVPFEEYLPIYESVQRLLEDKELYQSIAKQGKEDVIAKFDLKNMIQQLEQLYLS